MNDLLLNMENSEVTAFVNIDLFTAIDTTDHRILSDVLQHHSGVMDMARKWLESYISSRQVKVTID